MRRPLFDADMDVVVMEGTRLVSLTKVLEIGQFGWRAP